MVKQNSNVTNWDVVKDLSKKTYKLMKGIIGVAYLGPTTIRKSEGSSFVGYFELYGPFPPIFFTTFGSLGVGAFTSLISSCINYRINHHLNPFYTLNDYCNDVAAPLFLIPLVTNFSSLAYEGFRYHKQTMQAKNPEHLVLKEKQIDEDWEKALEEVENLRPIKLCEFEKLNSLENLILKRDMRQKI